MEVSSGSVDSIKFAQIINPKGGTTMGDQSFTKEYMIEKNMLIKNSKDILTQVSVVAHGTLVWIQMIASKMGPQWVQNLTQNYI